jgi:hypothetical protein
LFNFERLANIYCGLAENQRTGVPVARALHDMLARLTTVSHRFPGHCGPPSQHFYVNSGGLRAGKGPASRAAGTISRVDAGITCDLAAAAPKSGPGASRARTGWIEQKRDWTTP